MAEVIGEMLLEEAVGSLISVIVKAIQKTAMFKEELKKLQGTLESLNPVIKKIIESNKELDRTDPETKNLESLLEKGKKLVQDCLKVKSWNCCKKHSNANKLIDLDNSFLRSLTLLQAQAIEIGLDINKTVRRIDVNIQRIGLGYVQSEITDYCLTPEVPPFTDGLDEPLNYLRRWALGDDTSVLVLTAPGGCGKTTLAMKLCSDEKIQEKFKKNIFFVDVPREPSLKLIVQALCKHNGYQENHFQDDKLVVNRLKRWKDEIGQHPLLLVLDDIWPKWESLIDNFAFQKPHCKVLVTSRSEFPSFGPSYRLEKLQEKEATTLLRHYASLEDQENSRIPEDLVNQVVKHCKGYPLALKVIGKSLCGKSQEVWLRKLKKWSKGSSILIENELLACLKSSLDAMDEETEGEKGLLKECFLDLGLFPEGQWIPLTALIDMWKELYEIDHAAAYLSDLSNENMANLVVSRKDANELDGYYSEHFVTQHDMLKELAIHENRQGPVEQRKRLILDSSVNSQNEWKDLNEQPINAKLLSISTDGLFPENWSNKQLPAEVLVLNFQTAKYALPVFVGAMNKLKVLIITNYGFFPVEVDDFQLLGSLSSLRRMRLERIAISSLTKIPAQKNLKKISLFTCKFDQAFSSLAFKISDIFPNLEEINIDYCDDLVELPPGLCEIVSLKTLSITHCHKLSKLPEEIENLVNLEVLRLRSCIDMTELPDSICKLDKLTFLDISDCFSIRKLPEDIGKLCSLRTLNMRSCSRLPELPPSVVDLEHLKEVICDEELKEQWELCLPSSINIKLKVVKDDINLNWL
ncbi:hypothetical protein UlMin_039332 [Ulmus minor]